MKQIIKSELRMAFRNRAVRLTFLIYIIFLLFMFFQKAMNTGSGFYQKDIITPFYMMAFLSTLVCVTCDIPMCVFMGSLAGDCFDNNTCMHGVHNSGRIHFWLGKLLCAAVIACLLTASVFLLGLILGLLIHPTGKGFSFVLTGKYFLTTSLILYGKGMSAFLFGFLLRKSNAGIIMGIMIAYGSYFLESISPTLYGYYTRWHWHCIVTRVFSVITENNDRQIQLLAFSRDSSFTILCVSLGLIVAQILVIAAVSRKREYTV